MPKELEQRLLEWATAINLVAENIDNCGIIKSIENELKKDILSQDKLFAIFENYAPYPKTHKLDFIFDAIQPEYQGLLFKNFKDCHSNYLMKQKDTINQQKNLTKIAIEDFKIILKKLPNFADLRYISAGNGTTSVNGTIIGSLANSIIITLSNIKKD